MRRALLIVNPRATSTTRLHRDVIASALASAVDLDVVQTRYRGHASALAATAREEGFDLVLTLGGDGTVNEAVNGILGTTPEPGTFPAVPVPAPRDVPALAPLPGGSANVFAGALGLPRDPVDATGQVLRALGEGKERLIGLGQADGRFFTFNAGLGLDAEVVRAVQGVRAHGRTVTPSLYVRLALRQYFSQTDRRHPAITIEPAGQEPAGPVFLGIVANTAPWTYLGARPVHASPSAGFDTGLDVFAMSSLSAVRTFLTIRQMLFPAGRPPHGRHILHLHDLSGLRLSCARPAAFQIDGEYVGEREAVEFRSVPQALRVVS